MIVYLHDLIHFHCVIHIKYSDKQAQLSLIVCNSQQCFYDGN